VGAAPYRIALIGLGKIARDQHLPAIAGDPRFELTAVADPAASLPGLPSYHSLSELLSDGAPLNVTGSNAHRAAA
jgi:D-galactose 1-dehydrogenase